MTAQPQVPFHSCPWGIECGWRIPYLSSQLQWALTAALVITHSPLFCPPSPPGPSHIPAPLGPSLWSAGNLPPTSLERQQWPQETLLPWHPDTSQPLNHMDRPLCSGVKQSPTLGVSTQLLPHKETALATPPPTTCSSLQQSHC